MYYIFMKCYNIVETAKQLGVTQQMIYYWIKKGWVKPKRDYRDYPVFTISELYKIKLWKNKIV